jgi:hypothetical protein
MRWNRIGREGLARELGVGLWYLNRLLTGQASPDEDDVRKLISLLGMSEIAWAFGLTGTMPEWLKEAVTA